LVKKGDAGGGEHICMAYGADSTTLEQGSFSFFFYCVVSFPLPSDYKKDIHFTETTLLGRRAQNSRQQEIIILSIFVLFFCWVEHSQEGRRDGGRLKGGRGLFGGALGAAFRRL